MATMGNLGYQLAHATPRGISSLRFDVVYNGAYGAAFVIAYVTGIAELSAARVAAGVVSVSPGCQVICLNSVATVETSALTYYNTGATTSTVTWAAVCSGW